MSVKKVAEKAEKEKAAKVAKPTKTAEPKAIAKPKAASATPQIPYEEQSVINRPTRRAIIVRMLLECKHTDQEIIEAVKESYPDSKASEIGVMRRAIHEDRYPLLQKAVSNAGLSPSDVVRFIRNESGKLVQVEEGKKEVKLEPKKLKISKVKEMLPVE